MPHYRRGPAPKITRVKLEWMIAQVAMKETGELTRYLCNRVPSQRDEANAAGWTVQRIIREGFILTAPHFEKEFMRGLFGVLAGVRAASPTDILPYVLESVQKSVQRTGRLNNADVLWLCKKYRESIETRHKQFGENLDSFLGEIDAIEVMIS